MVQIEVKKAIAINCWRIMVNGIEVDRFERKYLAEQECARLKREYTLTPLNVIGG